MKWYRSFYLRIALGVVAFLAAMLIVQAVLFTWVVSQSGRTLPGQSPARLGMTVAIDLAQLLERDPQADLSRYVRDQYAQYDHPFFVMMADGRYITSGSRSFPEALIQMAKTRLERGFERPPRGEGPRPDRPDRPRGPRPPPWWDQPDRFADRFERDPSGARFIRPSPIIVRGQLAGVVVVPPQAPFVYLLTRFAPMLTAVAAAVLIVGAVLTSVMIFGPARRRLRLLEGAARRLGSGDLTVRAPAKGGDEIAAVASAFNAMASDLAARAEALAASDRMRRQLLADVSHELNTPVTAMRGYLETLRMEKVGLDAATRERYFETIERETLRLDRIVQDLVDLARLENGVGAMDTRVFAIERVFEHVVARHEAEAARRGVALRVSIGEGADQIVADPDRIEQVVENLMANALRFTPSGGAIELSSRIEGGSVVLSVVDSGEGIAPQHLAHVFDRFYKADPSRVRDENGSGLGLSISKAIVERHHGSIEVTSVPGRTAFTITLPASC